MGSFLRPSAATATPDQKLATLADTQIWKASGAMLSAYEALYAQFYANPSFVTEYGAYDEYAAFAGFAAATNTGLSSTDIQNVMQLFKGILDRYVPGTEVDLTPPMTFVF